MNITNNMTAPSFQAKLKKDENVEKVIGMMDNKEIQETKELLKTLDKENKDVVIEYYKGYIHDDEDRIPKYGFCNPKTGFVREFQRGGRCPSVINFIDGLRSLCDPNDSRNRQFFGASDKNMKEILDMLA